MGARRARKRFWVAKGMPQLVHRGLQVFDHGIEIGVGQVQALVRRRHVMALYRRRDRPPPGRTGL